MNVRAVHALIAAAGLGLLMSGCDHMYGGVDKGLAFQGLPTHGAVAKGTANVGAVKRGDNLYDVVYFGNDKVTDDYRRDMTLIQSAELCKSQGFRYFKASDTQAFSNHIAPVKTTPTKTAADETPLVTLQVSCYQSAETALVAEVDTVIARITTQYTVN